jgi:hypothetical protein
MLQMPRPGASRLKVLLAAVLAGAVLVAAPLMAAANTVRYFYCADSVLGHCYAVITQGIIKVPIGDTLSNLSSGTAGIVAFCQIPANPNSSFVDNEFWLVTTPNPSGPAYQSDTWSPEYIEYGLITGQSILSFPTLSFFWARFYWAGSPYNRYLFNQYLASGRPSFSTNYDINIRWIVGSPGTWEIYRAGVPQITGIQSQQPPGSHQGLQAGAEMSASSGSDSGKVSDLSDVQSGIIHNGWTGYVYYDPNVYSIPGQNSTFLDFAAGQC